MKKLLIAIFLFLPLAGEAATATSTPAVQTASNMLTQLPTFLTKLDTLRGKALSATEKDAVTTTVTQSNTTANKAQAKFLDGISSTTGLDSATLGLLFPSATQKISNTDLTGKLEGKMGKKLDFLQKTSVTTANSLRNNSLDSLKTSLSNNVANKLGMDPSIVTSLLPLLGF